MMPGPRRVWGAFCVLVDELTCRDRSVPLPLASLTRTCVVITTPRLDFLIAARAGFVNFTRISVVPAEDRLAEPVATTTGLVRASSFRRFAVMRSTESATEIPHASLHVTRHGTPRWTTVARRWRVKERIDAPGGVRSAKSGLPGARVGSAPGCPAPGRRTGWIVVVEPTPSP